MEQKRKLSIICFSGDFDRALAAFTLATGSAACNWEVTMFFTFWGLNILKKKPGRKFIGRSLKARMFNFLMGGSAKMPMSRLNFGGMSPKLMTGMMKRNNVATFTELREAAVALDINLIACEMAMNILEVTRDDLIDEVKEVIGVATFLRYSEDAQVVFI